MNFRLQEAMRTGRVARCACAIMIGIMLISAAPAGPTVSAATGAVDDIQLRVQTPAYELDLQGLRVPGYGFSDTPGAPQLPVWSTTVELPPTGSWQITSSVPGTRVIQVPATLPSVPVPNMPPAPPEGWNADNGPTAVPVIERPDAAIYEFNGFYPTTPVVTGGEQWQRGRRLLGLRVFPFQYNPVAGIVRYHPDVRITIHITPGEASTPDSARATGTPAVPGDISGALRLRTAARGMHRLTYNDLLAAGVPVTTTTPANFAVTYLGQPVAIEVTGEGDGQFDPGDLVIFYAEPYQGRYMNQNVYWFTYDGSPSPRMTTRAVTPAGGEPVVTQITQTLHVEVDVDYRALYNRPAAADHWFDNALYPTNPTPVIRTYSLALDDLAPGSSSAIVRTVVFGGQNQAANPDQSMVVRLNSHTVGTYQWEGSTEITTTATVPAAWLDGAPNQIILEAALSQLPGLAYYWISPDWVELTYQALADAENDRLYIEAIASGANEVVATGFTSPDVGVYDLRDPRNPVRVTTTVAEPAGGGYTLHFWDADLPGPTYFLSAASGLMAPASITMDTLSSWRSPNHTADYIAIVHSSLSGAIQPLLDHRAAENMAVAKVDIQDIYDEFSAGRVDPEAIRSFLRYAYDNWNSGQDPPAYVLLVGDGHYDFTGASSTSLPNLIPPFLVRIDPWLGETAADNRFVSLDGPNDFLPEMHIGRIPAQTPADVAAVVDKIITYESNTSQGEWQRRVVFVADNWADPAGNFHNLSNDIRFNYLPDEYNDLTIYYNGDYFTGNDMRLAIRAAFDQDALMLQWFGHASRYRWGSISMFNTSDPPIMAGNTEWPMTISYSCWSGYFINLDANRQTLGETLLLTPQRGSIVDLSPSGLHVGSDLNKLNRAVVRATLQDRIERAGKAFDQAKAYYFADAGGAYDVIDSQVFFGDPALKLRLPSVDLNASTLAVNTAAAQPGETLTYTLTLSNSSPVTATNVSVAIDYDELHGQVTATQEPVGVAPPINAGGILTWTVPSLAPGNTHIEFDLLLNASFPSGITEISAPTTIYVNGVLVVNLDVSTDVSGPPFQFATSLDVSRAWVPPGQAVTYTLLLSSNAGMDALAQTEVTLTLPSALGDPIALGGSLTPPAFDPLTRRVTWDGPVYFQQPVSLTVSSVVTPALTSCAQVVLPGDVRDGAGGAHPVSASIDLAVPDVDCSGLVNIIDVQTVAGHFSQVAGDPNYHPRYDLDGNDVIGVTDVILAAQSWQ